MNTPTVELIEELLEAGSLEPTEAKRRAPMVHEDFQWIGFKSLWLAGRPCLFDPTFCIPEYHFGDTGFSIDNAEHGKMIKAEWNGGTGLDRGHLQFFSQISVIGRTILTDYWHQRGNLRDCLQNPRQHLDTLEEIWWLDRWFAPKRIRSSVKLINGCDKDVDWCFTLADGALVINMEVKRLPSDCLRHTKGRKFKGNAFEQFCKKKVTPKFRKSNLDEVNVLAISLFGEIDHDVQLAIGDWLTIQQDVIDAVVVTSREARSKIDFNMHLRNDKAHVMRLFLREPTVEDRSLVFDFLSPLDIPGIPAIIKP